MQNSRESFAEKIGIPQNSPGTQSESNVRAAAEEFSKIGESQQKTISPTHESSSTQVKISLELIEHDGKGVELLYNEVVVKENFISTLADNFIPTDGCQDAKDDAYQMLMDVKDYVNSGKK